MEKIKKEYHLEENELHLFFWYMGYRACLDNFLDVEQGAPADAEVRKFVERHKGLH